MERKKFNKKLKELQKKAKTFEVGIFNPESARKGMLLDRGERGQQIARPWFSHNMTVYNDDFKDFMVEVIEDYYEGKISEKEAGKLMADFCKSGLDLAELKDAKIPEAFVDFNSGYFNRYIDQLPKQGSKNPWRVKQDYLKDLIQAEEKRLLKKLKR